MIRDGMMILLQPTHNPLFDEGNGLTMRVNNMGHEGIEPSSATPQSAPTNGSAVHEVNHNPLTNHNVIQMGLLRLRHLFGAVVEKVHRTRRRRALRRIRENMAFFGFGNISDENIEAGLANAAHIMAASGMTASEAMSLIRRAVGLENAEPDKAASSAAAEVHLSPGRMIAVCPLCGREWSKDSYPEIVTFFPEKQIMTTEPLKCPHCNETIYSLICL